MRYGKFRLDKTEYRVRKSLIKELELMGHQLGKKKITDPSQFMPNVNTAKLTKLFIAYMLYDFLPAVGY